MRLTLLEALSMSHIMASVTDIFPEHLTRSLSLSSHKKAQHGLDLGIERC